MITKKLLSLIMLCLIILIACSSDNADQTGQNVPSKEIDQEPIETSEPQFYYPLTGLPSSHPVTNRIVSVMINNHPAARPQTGLSQADIVFELLAEGQTTRFLAMFQSEEPEVVGPVRSARPYYFNLADDYNALYVYHGAADFIENMLKGGAADHLNGAYFDNDGHLFVRESFRVAPHNSYLQYQAVADVATNQGYDMEATYEPLTFLDEEAFDDIAGEQRSEVTLYYGQESVRYVYDETMDKYLRYNNQQQTVELGNETAIELDNVFIIETPHQVIDDQGRRDIDLTSGGNAYLLQKGKIQKIQWKNSEGRIIPVRNDEPVGFVPGKTWVNVVPTDPGLNGITEME
ncbi:DUF3048 domain-containing protein [Amphibacillus cookii]|uniref:DUF3048 domain-containing protein n=1 Tax=Amphibacillus cookii TaxID=767787 RepID=UPI00195CD45B|nr:DUF3048 domain-containing protein [Amphibacillus cookii]MBM7542182.1 hypothetical protein [Amphibacillus cookii]